MTKTMRAAGYGEANATGLQGFLEARGVDVAALLAGNAVRSTHADSATIHAGRCLDDPALPGWCARDRHALYMDVCRVLVALHGLSRPACLRGGDDARCAFVAKMAVLQDRYRLAADRQDSAMAMLREWLSAHAPEGQESCMVHGDFSIRKLVVHDREPRVLALIDWELAACGYAQEDLAGFCMSWRLSPGILHGMAGLDVHALGIPAERMFVQDYCRMKGREDIAHWDFFLAYGFFRAAVDFQEMAHAKALAAEGPVDDVAVRQSVRQLAELGLWCVRRAEV